MNTKPVPPFSLLQAGIRFLLYSTWYIALGAALLTAGTYVALHGQFPPWQRVAFIFFSTLLVYNVHYYAKMRLAHERPRTDWSREYRYLHLFHILLSIVALPFLSGSFSISEWWVLLASFLLASFYAIPYVLPLSPSAMAFAGGWKSLFLAGTWTLVTAGLPLGTTDAAPLEWAGWLLQRFFFMLALCLTFDIRDRDADAEKGLRTWPVRLGVTVSYRIIRLCLVLAVLFAGLLWWQQVLHGRANTAAPILNAHLLAAAAAIFYINVTEGRTDDVVYLGGIDGMILLQGLLLAAGGLWA